MNNVLIVYESMFGNTRDVAMAIADGIRERMSVEMVEAGSAPETVPETVELLIVGGPTHQFGMSRASSREQAGKQITTPLVSPGAGIREWLDVVQFAGELPLCAAFDTTMERPRFLKYMGRASRKIQKRLQRKGLSTHAPAESFWVTSGNGPLAEGELDRARTWGASLAQLGSAEPVMVSR